MPTTPTPLRIRAFDSGDVAAAARLLAGRHARQRRTEPALDAAWEDPGVTAPAIEALVAAADASGAVALRGDEVVGYLVGVPRGEVWGANRWVEGAGHAVAEGEAETIRDLYGAAAGRWVDEGAPRHYVIVPADDPAVVDAWFRVGFGAQHVHALREVPAPGWTPRIPDTLRIRGSEPDDAPALARIGNALPEHQGRAPVFSHLDVPPLDEVEAEIRAEFGDPDYPEFVAVRDGVVVGSAVGCALERSSEHRGIVSPPSAGFLGFAAVLPEARGSGAGRALGETVLAWARDEGYRVVVTDWRETNLLSSRAWPALGFRPIFRRLYRAIP